MIDRVWAKAFAAEWIEAWNSHDLDRILSHYTDEFEMSSPLIVERMGVAEGVLRGKQSIRPYWQRGLDARPPLVAEVLTLDGQGRVVAGAGVYGDPLEF